MPNQLLNPEIHKVKYNGRVLALDTNASISFELDSLSAEVLDQYGSRSDQEIISRLSPKYSKEEITDTLEELRQLAKMGFFAPRSSTPPLRLPQPSQVPIDTVRLVANHDCNLGCKYCYTERGVCSPIQKSDKPRRMPEDQAIKVIDLFVNYFLQNGKGSSLTFSFGLGGEPLLALDLFRSIKEHIDKRRLESGKKITYLIPNTNATLLTSQVADELAGMLRNNLSYEPVISIDGPKHIHDAMRQFPNGEGSYDRIEPLVKEHLCRWPAIGSAVLTGQNPYITEIFLHLFDLGFRSIHIKPVRAKPDASFAITEKNIEAVKAEYTRFVNFLLDQDDFHLLCYLSAIHRLDFFGRFFIRLLVQAKLFYRCTAGKSDLTVDTQGDIYPCDSFVGLKEFRLGNLFDGGIDEARRKQFFLLHVDNKPVCSDCWARYLCGGGCYYSAWLATGRVDTPDPVKCKLVKHLIEQGMVLLAEIQSRDPRILKAIASRLQFRSPPAPPPVLTCNFTDVPPFFDARKWQDATALHLDQESQFRGPKIWGGKEDLSGTVRTLWDERCFYLRAEVTDDKFLPPSSVGRLTEGDSIQFAVVPNLTGSSPDIYTYGVAFVSDRPVLVRTAAPLDVPLGKVGGSRVWIKRRGNRTVYLAAIPWEELSPFRPAPDKTCGFNVILNERDHPFQSRAWMEWTPGMVVEKDSALFGRLKFVRRVTAASSGGEMRKTARIKIRAPIPLA